MTEASEWMGTLPEGWKVLSLRHMGEVILGLTYSPSDVSLTDEGKLVIRASNIQEGKLVHADDVYVQSEVPERIMTRAGDLVICSRNGSRRLIGKCAMVTDEWVGNTFGAFMTTVRSPHSEWLKWVLASSLFEFQSSRYMTSTINQLTTSTLKSFPVPIAPLDTQQRIARFLDEKTAQIDGLIEKKRSLLERLAEKRQALITRAVTKGLDPAATMKPSGIDWLGDIPAHWEVKRLKYIVPKVTVGIVVTPAAYYADQGILAIRGLNVRPMDFNFGETRNISEDGHALHRKSELYEGDLVAVRTGDPGTTSVITAELEGSNCIDLIIIRKPLNASSRFLGWFLNSDAANTQYTLGSEGALQLHFNVETSKETTISLPPPEEQEQITAYIDQSLNFEDSCAAKVQKSVNLLFEYRAALITAAVTGQITALR